MPTLEPKPVRWTVAAFDRLTLLGAFDRQRVELLAGRIVRMPPQLEPHVAAVHRSGRVVAAAFGPGFYVRTQAPLRLGKRSKPEPDVAVVPGSEADYVQSGPPTTALLVIEVSDTTLRHDRTRKAAVYARFGIADYWVLNLIDRQLEVHRRPVPDAANARRFRYEEIRVFGCDEAVSPLAMPQARVMVSDMLV